MKVKVIKHESIGNTQYLLVEDDDHNLMKIASSSNYNYEFKLKNGEFVRWGTTIDNDPIMAPVPEILDIEISESCSAGCLECYKSNTPNGRMMSISKFKKIFTKLPLSITQIAFGIGDIDANPDMFAIFDHCKENNIIPNLTINGFRMTPELFDRLASTCGAVAVSCYEPKDYCYNAVKELTDRGLTQTNIHMILSEGSYDRCVELLHDSKNDPRLAKLNAIVFLFLKPKGNRNTDVQLASQEKYNELIKLAVELKARIGFDSCSGPTYLKYLDTKDITIDAKFNEAQYVDPCESTLFSLYINTVGEVFPCSFVEGESNWETGINLLTSDSLVDVWYSEKLNNWRKSLLDSTSKCGECTFKNGCRKCPQFKIGYCDEISNV